MTEERFESVDAVIEIPRGSRNKYEYDHQNGGIRLDRVLYSSVHYPTDYGFLPGFEAADGDLLDVLVLVDEPTFPGCRMRVKPIGVLLMRDEAGTDEKVLAVSVVDPRYEGFEDIGDVQPHRLREIENFFDTYKELERSKQTTVEGWRGGHARGVLAKYRRS